MTAIPERTGTSCCQLRQRVDGVRDLSELKDNLRKVFEPIGGEPSSGSAASVISNSRSGEGAIFQAVFSLQEDLQQAITWAGDVHALWLDEQGNIREDCGLELRGRRSGFPLDQPSITSWNSRPIRFPTPPGPDFQRRRRQWAYNDVNPAVTTSACGISVMSGVPVSGWPECRKRVNPAHNVKTQTVRRHGGTAPHNYQSRRGQHDRLHPGRSRRVGRKRLWGVLPCRQRRRGRRYHQLRPRRRYPGSLPMVAPPRGYRSRKIDWDRMAHGNLEAWRCGQLDTDGRFLPGRGL